MKFFDVHCHLDKADDFFLNNLEKEAKYISCGYDEVSIEKNLKLQNNLKNVFCCIGIAPQTTIFYKGINFENDLNNWIDKIQKNIKKCVGIGEVGLDFFYSKTDEHLKRQTFCFQKMIEIAEKNNLPIVLHSRNAEKECFNYMLSSSLKKVLFHFYSSDLILAKKIEDQGFKISIPPRKSKKDKKIILNLDLKTIFTETDAPYIINDPNGAIKVAKMISEYKKISLEEVLKINFSESSSFFSIGE